MMLFPVNDYAQKVASNLDHLQLLIHCAKQSGMHNDFVGVPGTEKAYEGYCRVGGCADPISPGRILDVS